MTPRPHVVVVGDVLLDVDVDGTVDRLAPDAPVPVLDVAARLESPGGAGLAALLCLDTARVTLVAPFAGDDGAGRVLAVLGPRMSVVELGHEGSTRRKVRLRTEGRSLLRVDDGGPGGPTSVPRERVRAALATADAVLVSDYGAGTTRHPVVRELLEEAARTTRVVWDPHPRGGDPVPGATLVTPNLAEARGRSGDDGGAPDVVGAALRRLWDVGAVCVTGGADGALLVDAGDRTTYHPAPRVGGGDPCGAGDRFAATVATALAGGALLGEGVEQAVADASGWVAAGGAEAFRRSAGRPDPPGGPDDAPTSTDARPASPEQLAALGRRLRGEGRTLVGTGGCFDIIHAGHVATLQAARRLGDRLVVLMNSDDSVRRLKGPGRPVVEAADRMRVLAALDCVDAVIVFDEDDPGRALDALAPDVWAKGGDYGGTPLPETEVVRRNGGRVIFLPYLGGRSTTSIIRRSEHALQTTTTGEQ